MPSAPTDETEWMLGLELMLVKNLGWSLKEIDETDIDSLIPFLFYQGKPENAESVAAKQIFCDDVDFL